MNHRTGLKSSISGPFFICLLVGVGYRMIVLGPRWGTLLGDANVCLVGTHSLVPLVEDEHSVFMKTIIPSP
jgi:hypothetical protein